MAVGQLRAERTIPRTDDRRAGTGVPQHAQGKYLRLHTAETGLIGKTLTVLRSIDAASDVAAEEDSDSLDANFSDRTTISIGLPELPSAPVPVTLGVRDVAPTAPDAVYVLYAYHDIDEDEPDGKPSYSPLETEYDEDEGTLKVTLPPAVFNSISGMVKARFRIGLANGHDPATVGAPFGAATGNTRSSATGGAGSGIAAIAPFPDDVQVQCPLVYTCVETSQFNPGHPCTNS